MKILRIETSDFAKKCPETANLADLFIKNSMTETTQKNYSRAIKKYVDFCQKHEQRAYPLDEISMIFFVVNRVKQKRPAYGTLMNELCGIKKFQHLTFDNYDTKSHILLKFCIKGMFLGDKKISPKMALTMQKLFTILHDFNMEIHDDLVIVIAFMCAELAMLRISEFCHNKNKPEKSIYLNNFEFSHCLKIADL